MTEQLQPPAIQTNPTKVIKGLEDGAQKLSEAQDVLKKYNKGRDHVIEMMMGAVLMGGHTLLEALPGTGKSRLAEHFGMVLGLQEGRVQFTPDLMPADITGADFQQPDGSIKFIEGPVFCQMFFGDEINRATARTQSALLQAMQEKKVTSQNMTRPLNDAFVVIATMNPVEQAGTYSLPEAQMDRFMIRLDPDDLSFDDAMAVLGLQDNVTIEPVLRKQSEEEIRQNTKHEIVQLREMASQIHVPHLVRAFCINVERGARHYNPDAPSYIRDTFAQKGGSGERSAKSLLKMGQAMAFLKGKHAVEISDVQKIIVPTFRHRLRVNPSNDTTKFPDKVYADGDKKQADPEEALRRLGEDMVKTTRGMDLSRFDP